MVTKAPFNIFADQFELIQNVRHRITKPHLIWHLDVDEGKLDFSSELPIITSCKETIAPHRVLREFSTYHHRVLKQDRTKLLEQSQEALCDQMKPVLFVFREVFELQLLVRRSTDKRNRTSTATSYTSVDSYAVQAQRIQSALQNSFPHYPGHRHTQSTAWALHSSMAK